MKKGLSLGFYFNVVLVVVLTCSAIFIIREINFQEQNQALAEAETKAKLILDRNLAIHTYFSHKLKPSVFELSDSVRPESYFEPAWMSSTYAVREIDKNFKALNDEDYYYKECAINARSPENEADEFEKDFIQKLNKNKDLKYLSLVRELNGNYFYVTLRRGEVLEESCLKCHSTPENAPKKLVETYGASRSFKRHVDEVISAISIRVPLSAAYAKANSFSRHLSMVFIIILAFIFAVHYLLYQLLVAGPVTHLQEKTLAISQNEERLGEELSLPLSREFRALTSAFNTMSLKLRHHMNHLEDRVSERTSELTRSNDKLQHALDEIKTIQGIIPICMYCKEIRDDKGSWNQLEKYIAERSDALFSHSICDKCMQKHYPDDAD